MKPIDWDIIFLGQIVKKMMSNQLTFFQCFSIAALTSFFMQPAVAIPVPNAFISFAGAGGVFESRSASFRVPDTTTVTPVKYGLRLYEIHLAKMIEVGAYFCDIDAANANPRPDDYIIYWHYEADAGKTFMGQYALTCELMREALQKYGSSGTETVTINYRGNAIAETIPVLDLNAKNAQDFTDLVQSIEPTCIEITPKICPGDSLE